MITWSCSSVQLAKPPFSTRRYLLSAFRPVGSRSTAAVHAIMQRQSSRAGAPQLRKMFIKVIKDGSAAFDARIDGPKFMRAALEFKDDPVDLLYCLTKAQEHGSKRLKAALSCADDPGFIRDHLLPFLALLGCDALGRGTCRQPLISLLETIHQVPGFLPCVLDALEADSSSQQLGCVAPLGWLALNTALHVPGARSDPLLQRMAAALETRGGAAASAAAQLKVLLAGSQPGAGSSSNTSNGSSEECAATCMQVDAAATAAAEAAGASGLVAVEDLWQTAGGRHDNDHQDFRDIRVMVTSQEALSQQAPFLPRASDSHLKLSSCPEAALLDRQFRLLREDMVGPLRKELHDLQIKSATAAGNTAAAAARGGGGATPQPPAGSSSSSGNGIMQPQPPRPGSSSSSWLAAAASSRNVFRDPAVLGVCFKPRPCIMVSISLPANHRASRLKTKQERIDYWSSYGHGMLPSDALVCLASPGWPLVFATVVRRDVQEMAEEQPMVGLAFEAGQDVEQVLQAMARGPLTSTVLVQVSTNFLSTRPVLQCLQAMPSVPMAQELVHGQHPQPTTYLDMPAVEKDLEQLAPSLDPSQQAALRQALQNRNALIQGPPGTGKTFTGALLCDLILKHSKETILCVCYTNHALDQFLESLLDKGINQIVRIGSRSKSKRLEQYSLRELAAKARGQTLNSAESRRFGALHAELESAQKRVDYLAQLLVVTAGPVQGASGPASSRDSSGSARGGGDAGGAGSSNSSRGFSANEAWAKRSKQLQEQQERAKQKRLETARAQGRLPRQDSSGEAEAEGSFNFNEWGDGIGPYLEDELPAVWEQLKVPEGMNKISNNYLWQGWLKGWRNKGAVDVWSSRGNGGSGAAAKVGDGDMSWHAAKRSKHSKQESSPEFTPSPAVSAAANALRAGQPVDLAAPELLQHVWSLPWPLRQALAASWRGKLRARWAEELGEELQQAHKLQQELRSLQDSSYEALLAQARVVGATTTGAALHKSLLTSQTIAPKIVMIEEAAEILEAHVLTSLSPATQHLIQIGDHKQLRPKVESYDLSVQAGRGHMLNVSLFERLVTAGMPHSTLAVQHRMHPDISRLIKHTYPALENHPSVASRPPVKGLSEGSSRVLFIDHAQPELQEAKSGIWSAAAEHQSKVNMHEVGLSVAVVKHLLQQGYQPAQLVLLTPYLAQLLELQRELSKVVQVLLSDLDVRDLKKAALPAALGELSSSISGSTTAGSAGISSSSGSNWQGRGSSSAGSSTAAGSGDAAASATAGAAAPTAPSATSSAIRVATIDNYQGEEADVAVASLVRSNSKGTVGFLREPERINVLLSRARDGLILIGNATTLRNASSAAARKHWGVVLDQLEASGSIVSGLPAACQRHSRSLGLLDSAEAFALHAPDGGCTLPCNATLPCGHACKLRCHAYDAEHAKQKCEELVLELCEQGHITTRHCWQAQAVCSTCVEIRQLMEEEKTQLRKLEFEAAKERAKVDKEKAKLSAHVDRLRQQLLSLSDQAAARQAAVSLELQRAKLQKELELQKRTVASDLAAWEEQQRQQADQELQQMEVDAQLQAEQVAAEATMQQQLQEEARLAAQLAAKQSSLQQLEQRTNTQLQDIENRKQRVAAATQEQQGRVEAKARVKGSQQMTVVKWRAALSQLASQGAAGLPAFHAMLQQAAAGSAESAADSLDVVFDVAELGQQLLAYATDRQVVGVPALSSSAKRGLSLMAEQKWVDAMGVFSALQQQQPDTNSTTTSSSNASITQSLVAICQAQLGLSLTRLPADKPSATFKIPMRPGKLLPPPPPAAALDAGTKSAESVSEAKPTKHPLQHLAAALKHSQQAAATRSVSSKPARSISAAGFRAQQKADAQAAGEALAFLLHPAVFKSGTSGGSSSANSTAAELPASLSDLALQLLTVQGKVAFSVSSTGLSPALGAAGAALAAGVGAEIGDWEQRAADSKSKALQELVKLTGLDPVKKEMFNLADQVALDKQRERSPSSRNFNVRFYGNPGTGKTTVARLYAQLLEELRVLPEAAVEETSGAALVAGGLNEIRTKVKKLEKGGVLFIDEAYQLDPAKNPMGAQVLNYLLPEMENKRGSLVVVLAGYQKPMEEQIMAFNEGLPSRFPLLFKFPDYSDEQLLQIFMGQLETGQPVFSLDDKKHARIAVRRLGRQRDSGAPGFGNARAVRNLLEASISRQSARVLDEQRGGLSPDLLLLKRDDLLGPKELNVSASQPLQQLAGLRGLGAVKASVNTLLGLIRTNAELEEQERPLKDVCLNRVFLGNPGTGKTTVAGIYGRILNDLGLLSKGDVLVKVPADFLGSVLGESEKKTMSVLEEARGCVLVIDEAYGLHSGAKSRDPYKEAVIDTIVAKVQGVPGDDRCVLLLGYPDQMEAMMREANPGLARRFQLAQAWQFEDYNKEDLLTITLEAARRKYGWELDWPVLQAALNSLDQERRRPNFGNAGSINNLLSSAAMRMEARTAHLSTAERAAATPVPEDFMSEADAAAAAARAAGKTGAASEAVFADLIGCKSVLAKLKEWQATITASQALGKDPLDSFELNFTFVGAPGTGKTTVARRVGMLFQQLGLLGTDQVVECSAGDFVTGYANQASGKTREMFEKALGGVLFIDEAYRLNPKHGGPFMSEVLDEVCQILTDKQFMGKMVVVLAGYEQQVEELLAVNPGLKSRFSERLVFPDFSVEDAVQLLVLQLTGKQYGLELSIEAQQQLRGLMRKLTAAPGWSNGRDVGTWAKRIFRAYSLRQAQGGNMHDQPIIPADLEASLQDFLASKTPPPAKAAAAAPSNPWEGFNLAPPPAAFASQEAPSPAAPAVQTATAAAPPAFVQQQTQKSDDWEIVQEPSVELDQAPGSFGGLPNQFLQDMQAALEALGFDLTSPNIMQQLAGDPALASKLLPLLGGDAAVAAERVRQWQQAIEQQLEQEREAAKKQQRPVWRCAVCGRYGCPVAPYIERYEEV